MSRSADVDALLRGYEQPTDEQIAEWWQTADIAIDTNVLLNLYRYSAETREQLLRVLRDLGDQLWIPHRAGEEFARNRLPVLHERLSAQMRLRSLFDGFIDELGRELAKVNRDLSRERDATSLHERATTELSELRDELIAEEQQRFGAPGDLRTDPLLDEIKALMAERLGDGLSASRVEEIVRREGPDRYRRRLPPGFKDADKTLDEDRFGDLIIWTEIVERAAVRRRPVIIVTDDAKDDWLHRVGGKTVGPHPFLVRELWDAAAVPLLVYGTPRFLALAGRKLNLADSVSEEAITEIDHLLRRLSAQHKPRSAIDLFTAGPRADVVDAGRRRLLSLSGYTDPEDRPILCFVREGTGTWESARPRSSTSPQHVTYPDDFPAVTTPLRPGLREVVWERDPDPSDIEAAFEHIASTSFVL